jgi:hypothetical protein
MRRSRIMSPPIHIVRLSITPITAGAIISRHVVFKAFTAHHLARAFLGLDRGYSIHRSTAIRSSRHRDSSVLASALDSLVAVLV